MKLLIWILLFVPLHLFAVNHVVIISIDGLRPDAIDAAGATELQDLRSRSKVALDAKTITPSITLPSHTSMLTGRDISIHEITWNRYKPERGYVQVPTVFEIAKARGLSTAMFVGKEKLKHLAKPGTLDVFSFPAYPAKEIAVDFVRRTNVSGLRNLTFIHLPDPDGAGHRYKWMSKEYFNAVRDSSKAVKIIEDQLNRLEPRDYRLILTSDHGGHGRHHKKNIAVNRQIPWMLSGPGIVPGAIRTPVMTYDTAPTALKLLGIEAPVGWEGKNLI